MSSLPPGSLETPVEVVQDDIQVWVQQTAPLPGQPVAGFSPPNTKLPKRNLIHRIVFWCLVAQLVPIIAVAVLVIGLEVFRADSVPKFLEDRDTSSIRSDASGSSVSTTTIALASP